VSRHLGTSGGKCCRCVSRDLRRSAAKRQGMRAEIAKKIQDSSVGAAGNAYSRTVRSAFDLASVR
jgi:hypothetical protein